MDAQSKVHGSRVWLDVGFTVEGAKECESKWIVRIVTCACTCTGTFMYGEE